MSANLVPFAYEGKQVRVVTIDGEPWFVAVDLCGVLSLSNPTKTVSSLDGDDLTISEVIDSVGRTQRVNVVSEAGLYQLIALSRKPEAKPFKRWVFSEVLPQIRKTGSYGTAPALTGPELMAAALLEAQATLERAHRELEAAAPKIAFADAVSVAETDCTVAHLDVMLKANGFEIGGVRLFALLRRDGYLCSREGMDHNRPTQKSMELGLFRLKETVWFDRETNAHTSFTPYVTTKGQQYFLARYGKKEALR